MKQKRNSMGNVGASAKIKTEKGGAAYEKTDSPCVDLFSQVLPDTKLIDAEKFFHQAWEDDPDLALKVMFNFGNVRKNGGGKNDEKTFARSMIWLWKNYPKTFLLNIDMISEHTSLKLLLDIFMYILHWDRVSSPYNLETRLLNKVRHEEKKGKITRKQKWKAKRDEKRLRKIEHRGKPDQLKRVREELVTEYKQITKNDKKSLIQNTKTNLVEKFGVNRDTKEALLRDKVAKIIADGLSNEFNQLVQHRGGKVFASPNESEICLHISGLYAKWAPTKNHIHDKATRLVHSIVPMLMNEVRDQIDQIPELAENKHELKELIKLQSEHPEKSVAHLYKDNNRLRCIAEKTYQKMFLSNIRRATKVPEHFTGTKEFDKVNFSCMPSRCRFLFGQKIYYKHAKAAYDKYLFDACKNAILGRKKGKKVNINSILPHEITKKAKMGYLGDKTKEVYMSSRVETNIQWLSLVQSMKEKLQEDQTFGEWIPLCDTSGSMNGNNSNIGGSEMDVAVALSLLMAESSSVEGNAWAGKIMTFQDYPQIVDIKGIPKMSSVTKEELKNCYSMSDMNELLGDLEDRLRQVYALPWGGSTDMAAAFDEILKTCKQHNLSKEKVENLKLCVFSDMEFDEARGGDYSNTWDTVYERCQKTFSDAGYPDLPTIVFWNLRASKSVPVADTNTKGVSLLAGYSAGLMRKFLNGQLELEKEIEVEEEEEQSEEIMDTKEGSDDNNGRAEKSEKNIAEQKEKRKRQLTPLAGTDFRGGEWGRRPHNAPVVGAKMAILSNF